RAGRRSRSSTTRISCRSTSWCRRSSTRSVACWCVISEWRRRDRPGCGARLPCTGGRGRLLGPQRETMFTLRRVFPEDLDGLHAVARHLDTVNLPDDRQVLERLIDQSRKSFSGQLDVFKREYLFVLLDKDQIIGTSMIHAQHGTRRAPHIFFDVLEDERYSDTLDKHFEHKVLRIGYNYNGPTEIGGLVLVPDYRHHALALGKWLSYVRFLLIGLHRTG